MNFFSRTVFLLLVILNLSACGSSSSDSPDKQDLDNTEETEELLVSAVCESLKEEAVRISVEDFSVASDNTDYKLYLEDFFNALKASNSDTLTSEETNAINAIVSKINEFLDYQISAGRVVGANNPLDFIEKTISTSSSSGQIQMAREMLATFIQNDGVGICGYRNSDIVISDLDGNKRLALQLDLDFNSFNDSLTQTVLMTNESSSLNSAQSDETTTYIGLFRAEPEAFNDFGYTIPLARGATIENTDSNEVLFIDDGYDTKLSQVTIGFSNTYCDQEAEGSDPSNYVACKAGVDTRVVQKGQCDGSKGGEIDEVNKLAVHSFDLNANFTNIKRLRIETDYTSEVVSIFVSQYQEAIFDSDGTRVIEDPTNCEKQAVFNELLEANPDGEGVRLTSVPDPNYDIQYVLDEDGSRTQDQNGKDVTIEPVAVIQFLGTPILSRK